MLAREPDELEGVRRGARGVATHQFEQGRVHSSKRERADMGEVRHPRLHAVDERNRAIDLAERPRRNRQIGHCADAGVQSEAKGQIVVAAGLEQGERTFQMIPRLAILAGEPASHSGGAMGDAGLRRIGSRLDVAEEGRRVRPHRRQFASHVAADPQAVVGRQSLGRVLVARRQLAGSGEGFRRFRCAVAARGDQRVAIGDVQLRQSLVRSGRAAWRPPRRRARPVRHRDRLAEMGDRLLEGRAAQRLVARLAPPFDREIVEAGLE